MKFKDFLNESHLSPSIDDNDVITTLEDNQIFYDRVKEDGTNVLVYNFDNRYSISYDGELFTLFRHGNKVHMANARNKKEIVAAIEKWNDSYKLADSELTDEKIDAFLDQMKVDNEDYEDKKGADDDYDENNDSKEDNEDDTQDNDQETDQEDNPKDDSEEKEDKK